MLLNQNGVIIMNVVEVENKVQSSVSNKSQIQLLPCEWKIQQIKVGFDNNEVVIKSNDFQTRFIRQILNQEVNENIMLLVQDKKYHDISETPDFMATLHAFLKNKLPINISINGFHYENMCFAEFPANIQSLFLNSTIRLTVVMSNGQNEQDIIKDITTLNILTKIQKDINDTQIKIDNLKDKIDNVINEFNHSDNKQNDLNSIVQELKVIQEEMVNITNPQFP